MCYHVVFYGFVFFFSSRRRHTRCREVSWARRCVQETVSTQSTWVTSFRQLAIEAAKVVQGAGQQTVRSVSMTLNLHQSQKIRVVAFIQMTRCEVIFSVQFVIGLRSIQAGSFQSFFSSLVQH
eukprot:TRINITY_DN38728_c0_g1_i1.p3 TRINITY_DN38728_c0_g1~~TRINITY_DN38728_c0_g1_i1.p3  ORF type:complete len:123 (+),score=22.01 TRINITY_DN38728_c0_g1_i1:27-395(+)